LADILSLLSSTGWDAFVPPAFIGVVCSDSFLLLSTMVKQMQVELFETLAGLNAA
jgi:hypothetical protein